MADALERLLALLDLEDLEVNIFRGFSPQDGRRDRVFGGQVLAQALIAAGRTAGAAEGEAQRRVHSFHAYFLRAGDPSIPILYEVDRSRDGRSFTSRRVVAIQHGKQIFHMSASFQVPEDGLEHQGEMPEVTAPEGLPHWSEIFKGSGEQNEWITEQHPLDLRYVDELLLRSGDPQPNQWRIWFRTSGPLPDDPLLHAAIAAYAADMVLLDSTVRPHGIGWFEQDLTMATIDHAMWFHRDFRADDWLLYSLLSPSASGARGLAAGELFARDGRLVATMAQEGLIRPRAPHRR